MITYQYIQQLLTIARANEIEMVDLIVKEHEAWDFVDELNKHYPLPEERITHLGTAELQECDVLKFMQGGISLNLWVLKFAKP